MGKDIIIRLIKDTKKEKILTGGQSMEISRDVYLNRLITRKQNGFVKVITGIRRCGKSYLLNTIFYDHLISSGVSDDHIIVFAFDSAEDLMKIGEDPLQFDNTRETAKADPKKFIGYINARIKDKAVYYLLLDEIQFPVKGCHD